MDHPASPETTEIPVETAAAEESLIERWATLPTDARLGFFQSLEPDDAQALFMGLSATEQSEILLALPASRAALWLRFLPPDDVADVIQSVDDQERARLTDLLDTSTLREVEALLAYSEDVAGGLMNPRYSRLRPDVSAEVAIRYLRRQAQNDIAIFNYAYVLDKQQHLLGVVSLRDLFAAPADALISDIMEDDVVSALETQDQEEVARILGEHRLIAVPVVDSENRMRGVITADDIVDVVVESGTEDVQKLGAVETLGARYLDVPFHTMIRKRGGWLAVLFAGELLTASAMAHFEHELARAVVLALFIPLIISSGGNTGSQAATLIVRSLALGELRGRDWWRVLRREFASGVVLGSALGMLGFARVVIWQWGGYYDYGPHFLLLGLAVLISLAGVVLFGTIVGSMLPFLLRRVGFDPATSSTPFVATLVDVTGLVIYFVVAAVILRGTLL